MRGHLAVLRSYLYIHFIPFYIVVYLVSLDSHQNKLLGNIIYVKIGKDTVKWGILEYENLFFRFYFLN